MTESALDNQSRALLLLGLANGVEFTDEFLNFFSDNSQINLVATQASLPQKRGDAIRKAARDQLEYLVQQPSDFGADLSDVHPDWIVDYLLHETPLLIAVVLRMLPTDLARRVLDTMPDDIVNQLPSLAQTFGMDSVLAEKIYRAFVKSVGLVKEPIKSKNVEFKHVFHLSCHQLEKIVHTLAINEIACGLSSLPEKTRDLILQRFPIADKNHIVSLIPEQLKRSVQRIKKAQENLATHDAIGKQSDDFMWDLGASLMAFSFLPHDHEFLHLILKRLPKKRAERLRHLVDQAIMKNTDASVVLTREELIPVMKKVILEKTV